MHFTICIYATKKDVVDFFKLLRWLVLKSSVADPVHFFRIRIRIRGSGFENTDPDPT